MNNTVKVSDLYVTSISLNGEWKPIPLSDGPIYQTLDRMDWSLHDDYVVWLNQYNYHQWITSTENYKKLFYSIKNEGFKLLDPKISFKNVYEYILMYELCKLPKKDNWHWVIKDGQHRLAVLLYFYKNALLEIDEYHIARRIIYE
jgi:hypothetical protein